MLAKASTSRRRRCRDARNSLLDSSLEITEVNYAKAKLDDEVTVRSIVDVAGSVAAVLSTRHASTTAGTAVDVDLSRYTSGFGSPCRHDRAEQWPSDRTRAPCASSQRPASTVWHRSPLGDGLRRQHVHGRGRGARGSLTPRRSVPPPRFGSADRRRPGGPDSPGVPGRWDLVDPRALQLARTPLPRRPSAGYPRSGSVRRHHRRFTLVSRRAIVGALAAPRVAGLGAS